MSVRTTLAQISLGMMLTMTAASSSLAQRIEPLAASSRTMMSDRDWNQKPANGAQQMAREPINPWRGVAGGTLGGGAGLMTGFFAGAASGQGNVCSGEDCGLRNALLGAMVGEAVGLAVGTHYGSRGHGNLALAVLTSTAIGVAGVFAAISAEKAAPQILAVVPVLQLTALLAMER